MPSAKQLPHKPVSKSSMLSSAESPTMKIKGDRVFRKLIKDMPMRHLLSLFELRVGKAVVSTVLLTVEGFNDFGT